MQQHLVNAGLEKYGEYDTICAKPRGSTCATRLCRLRRSSTIDSLVFNHRQPCSRRLYQMLRLAPAPNTMLDSVVGGVCAAWLSECLEAPASPRRLRRASSRTKRTLLHLQRGNATGRQCKATVTVTVPCCTCSNRCFVLLPDAVLRWKCSTGLPKPPSARKVTLAAQAA